MAFNKKLLLTITCIFGMLTGPITAAAMGPQQNVPNQMPPGGFPMGPMPMPSEEELEEALKFIQYLEEHDPEQLKALEQLGQQMINQMSDEDLAQFSEAFNIAPDELREEAAKGLAEQAPTQIEIPEAPAQTIVPQKPQPSKASTQQAAQIVSGLIEVLDTLRQKSSSVKEVHQMVRSWFQELRDLMFYLKIIDTDAHSVRLAGAEAKQLLQTLSKLYGELKIEVPLILLPDDIEETDSPYELLGIKHTASQKEIERAFNELSDKHDPEKVQARLTVEGVTGKDLTRRIKQAKLAYETLEDAYEQLVDPKMKEQVDREIEAQSKQSKQDIEQSIEALKNITTALGQAIYTDSLIAELESFLKKYAPEQLKQKQAMEAAEKKRAEEQKKAGAITPSKTPGTFETASEMPYYGSNDYGYYDDFAPYMYDDYYDAPSYEYGYPDAYTTGAETFQQPTTAPTLEKNNAQKKEKDFFAAPQPVLPQDKASSAVKKLVTEFELFDKAFDKPATQSYITELENSIEPGMVKKSKDVSSSVTVTLENLAIELNITGLQKLARELKQEIRELKTPTTVQRKEWFKLEDKRDEMALKLNRLTSMLEKVEKAYGKPATELLIILKDINKNLEKAEKFFEEKKDNKKSDSKKEPKKL